MDIPFRKQRAIEDVVPRTQFQPPAHVRPAAVRHNQAGSMVREELSKGPDISIIRFVDALVQDADAVRASDIHLDPDSSGVKIRFRIDGVLQDIHVIPTTIHSEVISRIKILCGLRTDEHQAAQDGRFRLALDGGSSVDVRVSIVPTYHGENAVLRLLSDQAEEFTLDTLGFTPENHKKILRAAEQPHGMILATGPTGSGKTTTLYTLVKMLNKPDVSIITIEDPIEYSISGINQIQVNSRTELTFANGLRSMLRQDPNIIMVGEIRDVETAGLAVNTALTGHLVLSTLHTNDAPTTLPRLLDMKVEPYLIASTVNIAIGQRLVRKLCSKCKEERKLSTSEAESLTDILPAELLAKHQTFYGGKGCPACNGTGYLGRAGLHEVMEIDNAVRNAILEKAPATKIREIAIQQGMVPMVVDGFCKAAQGVTSIEEVLRMPMSKKDAGLLETYFPTLAQRFGKSASARSKKPAQGRQALGRRPLILRLPVQDQIFFAKRLAMILRAGMSIMEGLHMLGGETRSRSATFIYQSLIIDVSRGQPLSTGLNKFQKVFGEFCVNIVKVGETSGTLHENLNYLAEELKKKQALRRKVIGSLIYPAVIVTATIGITVMLTVYIFPKIIPIFQSVKATLPITTQILIVVSAFLGAWGLWLLAGIAALCVGFFFLMRNRDFHKFMDNVLLSIPIFGKLSQYYNLANSSRTLSLLLKSDVRVVEALELVAGSTRNVAYKDALLDAGKHILKGQKISSQLQRYPRLFPSLMTQMVTVGESTGNLTSSLMYLSDMYEEQIEDLTKNLTTMLEPILMIVMGLIVGFIAISIITPIYSITSSLNPK